MAIGRFRIYEVRGQLHHEHVERQGFPFRHGFDVQAIYAAKLAVDSLWEMFNDMAVYTFFATTQDSRRGYADTALLHCYPAPTV